MTSERLERGLLDTSVFIATGSRRVLDHSKLPMRSFVSVITVAELRAGVLAARDTETRARRLATLEGISDVEALVIDDRAAAQWARLRFRLFEAGRRVNVNDLWIASVALANDLPVVTQDADYEVLLDLGGPAVVRV
ncbi:type II toxin-antitoxin system VapC family toxin [Herbiconiux sp. CPCC 205763]|uniref:Ribonuclease VapC n=1 Tax=Herbiconiux aconitum TaxID=2970913 RepID=A0ABT2GNB1_9MICO|nr:type II toxin-antitoxin system VapC family toxin [Herbiconiux aconitum]MCS5717077.1 type II toxin-antitoxin system VapC family toxin [Herbiconiux aconitum]